ncbi:MAG TPA: AAA family ATPase, partial [Defluviitoga tunisiensis]|nr:AAA family ATPase [Defluviitoga tunisiensis]
MKKLPIGIQSFKKIKEEGYYYIDKTKFIKELQEGYYFLSRPRRFGKSLFLDTLKEAFVGSKELFKGLYLYDNWDWDKKYPVIKLDLSLALSDRIDKLEYSLNSSLHDIAKDNSIELEKEYSNLRFEELIKKLSEKYGERVVVLIDEYDKPILDRIEEIEIAKQNREVLKKFFEVLKTLDPYLKLVFITGVSRFSKVSIFSGLNQLNDITIDERFSTICG